MVLTLSKASSVAEFGVHYLDGFLVKLTCFFDFKMIILK